MTVTAVTVGPEKAVDAVRKALQMGADAGVHVSDEAIAGSDAIATSLVLAAAVKKANGGDVPDLVDVRDGVDRRVDGGAAGDAGRAARDPAGDARPREVETQGDQVRVKRDGDVATEVIGGTMPLVLSVTDQSGEARYPSFKGIMAAKKKPMETYSLADLDVDASQVGLSVAWSVVEDTEARPPRTAGRDRQGRGRFGRHGADRLPRVQEVHLRGLRWLADMSEVLVLVDHADGAVKKPTYELLTIAERLGEPSAVFIGSPAQGAASRGAVAKYGAAKVYVVDDADIKGFLVAPKAEALAAAGRQDLPGRRADLLHARGQGDRGPAGDQDLAPA